MLSSEGVDKRKILDLLIEKLQTEVQGLITAAQAAHEAATHEESRAEDQHDTRGLEASYLAGAQAQRAAELQAQIAIFKQIPVREHGAGDPVGPGAIVELELGETGRKSFYFVVPRGGGAVVQVEGRTIQSIAPQSPLGEALMGRRAGESIEVEAKDSVREYRIVSAR